MAYFCCSSFVPRPLARLGRCWKCMRTVTYGWHLEARHGRSIQHASRPSLWRWTPTSWQLRTPTNPEVRPLPGRGGSSLTVKPASSIFPSTVSIVHSCLPLFQLLSLSCMHVTYRLWMWHKQTQRIFCFVGLSSSMWTGCPFHSVEMFFPLVCCDLACWQWDALAAHQAFVIMSKVLTNLSLMTKPILCMHFTSVDGRLIREWWLCVCVHVRVVWLNCMVGHFDSFHWFCIKLGFNKPINQHVFVYDAVWALWKSLQHHSQARFSSQNV